MADRTEKFQKENLLQYAPVIGSVLVVSGLLFLLDQRIHTKWLSISIPLFISVILIVAGIYLKKKLWLIPGFILFGLGAILFFEDQKLFELSSSNRLVYSFLTNGTAWLLLFILVWVIWKSPQWWALFVATISTGLAVVFTRANPVLLDYIFILPLSISVVFLLWGLTKQKVGLIIPGLLMSTIGIGVSTAWKSAENPNGLQDTGIMLLWFALGWLLITVFSRIIKKTFTWWPLIPGGLLLMVGSGLYIGGNPENTLGFLRNTGSIALILFGFYLILLKYGMKN